MNITLAENLKRLRRERELTQEDLAQFLGVTNQAVSKWERDEGYPDITMLPIIANYFEVTVDDLLGNDIISKEEKILQYCDRFWNADNSLSMDDCVEIAKKAYSEYPYDWRIIEIYIMSLTRRLSVIPDEKTVIELRRLCEFVMEKCTDATVRKRAVYTMIFVEDDEHVERWFAEAPDNADYLQSERREEWYCERGQWELYYTQKQNNMLDLVNSLVDKMGYYSDPSDIELKIESRRRRVELLEVLFRGTDRVLFSGKYGGCLLELAMALAESGKTEEAIKALAKAVDIYEAHKEYGDRLNAAKDEKVNLTDQLWDRLAYPAFPRKLGAHLLERLASMPACSQNEDLQKLLEKLRNI